MQDPKAGEKRPTDNVDGATTPWQREQPRNIGTAHSDRLVTSAPLPLDGASITSDVPVIDVPVIDVPGAPPKRHSKPWLTALVLVGAALVLAALAGLLAYWVESERHEGGLFGPSDEVLLMVLTSPKSATLYVDGVRTKSKSLQLSRAHGEVVLRVEARGYKTRQVVLAIEHTRLIRIVLTRSGASRAAGQRRSPKKKTSRASSPAGSLPATLDRQTVLAALRRLAAPIRACFEVHKKPGLLDLRIDLLPSGRAKGKVHGPFAGTPTAKCALGKLRAATTPRFSGKPLSVRVPFRLAPAKKATQHEGGEVPPKLK